MLLQATTKIAVVIPSYKVRDHILGVIANIGSEIDCIYVVDDRCPEGSGDFVQANCNDSRVTVIWNSINLGVGGGCNGWVQGRNYRRSGHYRKN